MFNVIGQNVKLCYTADQNEIKILIHFQNLTILRRKLDRTFMYV